MQVLNEGGKTATDLLCFSHKIGGKNGKMFVAKKGAPSGKKDVSQVSAEICLPAEWTY